MEKQKRILLLVVALFWFAQYVYVPYQTPFLLSIQTTSAMIGAVIGAYGFSQFALRMPVGVMADQKGRHKGFLFVGVAAAGAASLLRVAMPDAAGFFIGNLFSGLASAMWISFMVLYSNYFPREEMQKATGMVMAANNAGILAGFVVGALLYGAYGMEVLCVLSAAASLPALLLVALIKEPRGEEKPPRAARELIGVYKDRRLIFFSLIALALQSVMMSTCMSFTAQAAKQRVGAAAGEIGACFVVYIVAAAFSSYFAATGAARKRGAKVWIPAASLGFSLYAFLIPHITGIYALYAAQALAGIASGIVFSFCVSEAMRDVPDDKKSTAMGYHQAIYAIGMTAGPAAAGVVVGSAGLSAAFYLAAAVAFLAAVAALGFYWQVNQGARQREERRGRVR